MCILEEGGGGEGAANREVGVSCYVEVDSRCCVAFICYSVGVVYIYKEACAGPTQTFFRPDTRAQEMWVK